MLFGRFFSEEFIECCLFLFVSWICLASVLGLGFCSLVSSFGMVVFNC